MNHRVFIAINLPQYVKNKFKEYRNKWYDLPARWTRPESLHITLVFIGYVSSEEMLEICRVTRETVRKVEPFNVGFKKILLGPPGKLPRMIWAEGPVNAELAALKSILEDNLLSAPSGFRTREKRALCPHITLARIRQEAWRGLPEKPDISEDINLEFSAESVEVMESQLKRGGAEYSVLENAELGSSD